jgi:N-terminal acetyltransferase B complex non-catalytic subunit
MLKREDSKENFQIREYQEVVQKLEADLRQHSSKEAQLKLSLEAAEVKIEELEKAKERLAISSKQIVEDIRRDNQSLVDLLKLKEINCEDLKSQLQAHKKVIELHELKIKTIPSLELKLKEMERRHYAEVSKLTSRHKAEVEQSHRELKQLNAVIATNEAYSEKIKQLTNDLGCCKRISTKPVEDEKKLQKYENILDSKAKEVQKLEQKLSRQQVQLGLKDKEMEALTKANEELTSKVERLKHKRTLIQKPVVLENPLNVQIYKQRLKDKEEEVKKLKKRLGKMYHNEAKVKIKELNFEEERQIYKEKLAKIYESTSQLEYKFSKFEAKKVPLAKEDEADNIKEIARTAAEAYEKLLKSKKESEEPKKSARIYSSVSSRFTRSTRPQTASTTQSSLSRVLSARRLSGLGSYLSNEL